MHSEDRKEDNNEDPITGEPGAHPLGTAAGAIIGGVAGAALGTSMAGPIGGMAGAGMATGALAGGLIGKVTAEGIDPTTEDSYWREQHPSEPYAIGEDYETYEPAYRAGYEGYASHRGVEFEDVEEDIREKYSAHSAGLPWDKARPAVRAAWNRVAENEIRDRQ